VSNRLNLASKPFTNRALPWVVTVAMVAFSIVALAVVAQLTSESNAKAAVVQKEISGLNQQLQALQKDAEQVTNALTTEQIQSLRSANSLVDRKRFSWSRLFADLEGVLPEKVRVSRIAVRQVSTLGGRTVATLELNVIAASPNMVTDMIALMDQQGIFQAELITQSIQKGKGEAGSEYELRVRYSPRASFTSSPNPARAALEHPQPDIPGGIR
jgi:Tfp pilus assembly protein PilN